MILVDIVNIVILGIVFYLISKRSEYPLHMLQLEGYDNEEYKNFLNTNDKIKKFIYEEEKTQKTPIVWTDRLKRLFSIHKKVNLIILLIIIIISTIIYIASKNMLLSIGFTVIFGILTYYLQYKILLISNNISRPREEKINMGFYIAAQEKIRKFKRENNLKVLGITGSFGKTSVKFISNTILGESLRVKNTPSSFNTPMGLSKIINNELEEDREVFIAELGAKVPGEIKEVSDLVMPDIGIITAIGPTHMHLFKTIENIQKTKYELIEALPKDGVAIFNYDNKYVKPLADKTEIKTVRYGINDTDLLDIYAKDISVDENGSSFTLVVKDMGEVRCETSLLGVHNISNLLAAISAAVVLGMDLESIKRGVAKVEPVEHRLNIVDSGSGVIVIDDAFNSNPVGFRAALDVLNEFKNKRKIIVTPGMVELGDMEEEENHKIGREISKVCDFVILVGIKRTEPIYRGLLESNFKEENIYRVSSLDEATKVLGNISRKGDVVLFENDLPDNYNE